MERLKTVLTKRNAWSCIKVLSLVFGGISVISTDDRNATKDKA